ncbi:MAG: hypothetical protein C0514_04275 [Candidatus Puniceispirillum sp.]|nr:hypothetical protein [Candidatus Puniceispirillum sp.]
MSQEMTNIPAPTPVKSAPIWPALKEGFLFPLLIYKGKWAAFGWHMLFMTFFAGVGMLFVAPSLKDAFTLSPVVGLVAVLGVLGTFVLTSVYTMQRVVLGQELAPYLHLVSTPLFRRTALYFVLYTVAQVAYVTLSIALFVVGVGVILFIASYYIFARLIMIFPEAATRKETTVGQGWRLAKGYVLEIFCVHFVSGFGFMVLCVLAFSLWMLFGVIANESSVSFASVGLSTAGEVFGMGTLVGLGTWTFMCVPASLARIYKDIMQAEGIPLHVSLMGSIVVQTAAPVTTTTHDTPKEQ